MQTGFMKRIVRFGRAIRRPLRLLAAACLTLVAMALWVRLGSIDPALLDLDDATSTVVVDRRGVPLYESLSGDGTRSVHLDSRSLPPSLVAATIAAEDRRFWSHPGVDPVAIARAARQNLSEGRIVEGGSTITQQVAKLLLNRRSPKRVRGVREKIREAMLALRLERRFDKREILALYLNLAAYGNQVVGAGRASRAYFAAEPSMLTPAQAAFLAGLPQRPTGYNPFRKRDQAIARQRTVLRRMEVAGALTADQAREAKDERLRFSRTPSPFLAPHFVEMVKAKAGPNLPPRIQTTLDAGLQTDIIGIIRNHRQALERHGAANVAVVVLDNARGEWLAWEGSGDYADAEHGGAINGPLTPRQPGSALKPFTYALAFESGFTPASVLADVPSHFPTAEAGVLYSPRNYDGRYRGPLLARRALAGSENVPAVVLASELGVPALQRFLMRAGLSTFDRTPSYYGLGLTLGNAEVRLDELVAAYAMLARGGEWIAPSWALRPPEDGTRISRIHHGTRISGIHPDGTRISGIHPDGTQISRIGAQEVPADGRTRHSVVSPLTAYWITDILSDHDAREYIFGRGGSLEFPFPVAVKTGTSQAYHDNWTIGYTKDVTVGVWVGNFDRTPLKSSTGVTGAAPIFHAVVLAATQRLHGASGFDARAIVAVPDGVVEREVCALSGMPANPWCPARQRERLPASNDPPCSWHHLSDDGLLVIWPPAYRQWARQNGLMTEMSPRVTSASARPAVVPPPQAIRGPLEIVNPPAGATYLIDPTLRREFQTLPLRVVAASPSTIEWQVAGRVVGSSSSETALMWPLTPGVHKITARDERGRVAESSVVVK
jgi:penicillin-binding protein 1C